MKKYLILSEKKWNIELVEKLKQFFPDSEWFYIDNKKEFNLEQLKKLDVSKIFIPHWSYIIPKEIYTNFECIVSHMTDLPYGRGGSPLQNLIVRGHKKTKLSALKVVEDLDAGPIYIKKELSLSGTAEQIYYKVNHLVFELVCQIITENLAPKEQTGTPTLFKRRTPDMSNLSKIETLDCFYDMIRMLDAEGYPHAFLETEYFKIEFRNAVHKGKEIEANVRIIKK